MAEVTFTAVPISYRVKIDPNTGESFNLVSWYVGAKPLYRERSQCKSVAEIQGKMDTIIRNLTESHLGVSFRLFTDVHKDDRKPNGYDKSRRSVDVLNGPPSP